MLDIRRQGCRLNLLPYIAFSARSELQCSVPVVDSSLQLGVEMISSGAMGSNMFAADRFFMDESSIGEIFDSPKHSGATASEGPMRPEQSSLNTKPSGMTYVSLSDSASMSVSPEMIRLGDVPTPSPTIHDPLDAYSTTDLDTTVRKRVKNPLKLRAAPKPSNPSRPSKHQKSPGPIVGELDSVGWMGTLTHIVVGWRTVLQNANREWKRKSMSHIRVGQGGSVGSTSVPSTHQE